MSSKGGVTYHKNANMKTLKQHTSDQNPTNDAYMRLDVNGTMPNVGID